MANNKLLAGALWTLCQADWAASATLAHAPLRPGRDEQRSLVKLAQVVRDAACSLLEALAGDRSLLSALQAIERSHAFGVSPEQAQETSERCPTPRAPLDELGLGS